MMKYTGKRGMPQQAWEEEQISYETVKERNNKTKKVD